MSKVTWDALGERLFEIGLDHGVIYFPYSQKNLWLLRRMGCIHMGTEQIMNLFLGFYI